MGSKKYPAPNGLAAGGLRQWTAVTKVYSLRPDELATLEDICRLTDMIDGLTSVWLDGGGPTLSRGSMGQEVIHPLIAEIRAHRMARNTLWRQLKLPDLDEGAGEASKPNQQREAAQTRWAAAHGKGA